MATTPVFSWPYLGLLDPPNLAKLGEELALGIEGTLTGATPGFGSWESYVPVLTGSVSNPTNYTAAGRRAAIGKAVIATFQINAGAAFTAGSGDYSISLPITASLTMTPTAGSARLFDSSTGNAILGARTAVNAATTLGMQVTTTYGGTLVNVGAAVPWTWAASDIMDGFIIFEVAS